MAEFCLDCFNKFNETNHKANRYIISKDLDLCEGCGELKHVVVTTKMAYYLRKFRYILLPFKIIYLIPYTLVRLLILPYLYYKYYIKKRL